MTSPNHAPPHESRDLVPIDAEEVSQNAAFCSPLPTSGDGQAMVRRRGLIEDSLRRLRGDSFLLLGEQSQAVTNHVQTPSTGNKRCTVSTSVTFFWGASDIWSDWRERMCRMACNRKQVTPCSSFASICLYCREEYYSCWHCSILTCCFKQIEG